MTWQKKYTCYSDENDKNDKNDKIDENDTILEWAEFLI